VAGSDLQRAAASVNHVFANRALSFCPLLAGGSQKVGDECGCLCRSLYLMRCGARNQWMGSVWQTEHLADVAQRNCRGQLAADSSSRPGSQAFPQLFLADALDAAISPW